jgi:trimethylamine:corrinoid methyltransferase-like protein
MLSEPFIEQIVPEVLDVLGKTGVQVENEKAIQLLPDAGCECQGQTEMISTDVCGRTL